MKQLTSRRFSGLASLLFFIITSISLQAQVGINNTDPKTTLDVNGALSLSEGSAIALSDGTNNDIILTAPLHSMYRITGPTLDFELTGIVPVSGSDGQIVNLQNTTSQNMIIKHETGSIAENRIYIPGEKDLYLRGRYTNISLQYSATLSRWVLQNKLNHVETWHYGPDNISPGANTYTATIPGATLVSSASVNFQGNIAAADAANLVIEFIDTRAGQVVFRINNLGLLVSNVTFNVTINKI